MKTIHILVLLAVVLPLCDCRKTSEKISKLEQKASTTGDVSFAKKTFEALARGESDVADKIDWEVFTSMSNNVGATYVALPTETEKENLVKSFITQFATSFRESGGSLEQFTNWRVTFHNSLRTEVAADSPNGLLTIIVSERDDKERVTSISMIK